MVPRGVLYAVAALVVLALVGHSAIRGHAPENASEWLSPIGPAVTVAALGLFVFDRWAWRLPGIRKLHRRPLLHGTWHGELASSWVDPTTHQGIPADPDVFLVVRQRFWHVSTRLLTKESASASMLGGFKEDEDGVQHLIYVYTNTPRAEVRIRSGMHFGGVVLGAPRDSSAGLHGHYFTDRNTRGDLRLDTRYGQVVETYAAGLRLLEQPPR